MSILYCTWDEISYSCDLTLIIRYGNLSVKLKKLVYLVSMLGVKVLKGTQMLLVLKIQLVAPLSLQLFQLCSVGSTHLCTLKHNIIQFSNDNCMNEVLLPIIKGYTGINYIAERPKESMKILNTVNR